MNAAIVFVLLMASFTLHVVQPAHVSTTPPTREEATTDETARQAIINEMEAKLKVDCGPFAKFKYCAKNLLCFQHSDGMWDIARRPSYTCDPHNATHYGCQCWWSLLTDGTCSKGSCASVMREYFRLTGRTDELN